MVIRSFAELEAALRGCPSLRPALTAADDPATLAALAAAMAQGRIVQAILTGPEDAMRATPRSALPAMS